MIKDRTLTLTIYNVYCDHCGARGPDGISEVDAHIVARQAGWDLIENSYVCPSPMHAELKEMREFLVEMKLGDQGPAESMELLSWWR